MAYAVIIRGPLGIGKSTISRRLARFLHGKYISIDKVLEKHELDKIEGECIPVKNFIKANEIVLPEVKKELAEGRIVVFDGNFYHKEQIEHLTKNLGASQYLFSLKAPLEICIERDSKRKKAYGKDAAAAVHCLVSRIKYGTEIDTADKSVSQVLKEIKSHLPKR